ncbi:four helix bundle protein [Winogradskyella psychrotolerans]|uniref:four helix bundle protein n=1 Tax=Winogradskyella psychrotolerans TaxID=1344585 RepID=UPI000419A6FE|nr:four helix bundle protein [Winogradskyella psychrotolerans]
MKNLIQDKINKLIICLKELRESLRNLNIQTKAKLISEESIRELKDENDQLIRIIVTRIKISIEGFRIQIQLQFQF